MFRNTPTKPHQVPPKNQYLFVNQVKKEAPSSAKPHQKLKAERLESVLTGYDSVYSLEFCFSASTCSICIFPIRHTPYPVPLEKT
jgi:hypothetical protein